MFMFEQWFFLVVVFLYIELSTGDHIKEYMFHLKKGREEKGGKGWGERKGRRKERRKKSEKRNLCI